MHRMSSAHVPAAGLVVALATACSSPPPKQSNGAGTGGNGAGTGGSGGSGGGGGSSVVPGGVTLVPDESGWVDAMAVGNTVGVQGAWYPYGDKYGIAKCTNVGHHTPEECSTITSPPPLETGFPNENGEMCTTGETAVVLPCGPGVPTCAEGDPDYSNMWGAGIGLDLNAEGATDAGAGVKHTWNPNEHHVVGVAFEIDHVPPPTLRVEFPMVLPEGGSTEDHPDGSPYWGANADSLFPPSPVHDGHNEFRWTDVKPPRTNYVFDRTKILSIQFHVPAVTTSTERGVYSFCIKNLTFLTE